MPLDPPTFFGFSPFCLVPVPTPNEILFRVIDRGNQSLFHWFLSISLHLSLCLSASLFLCWYISLFLFAYLFFSLFVCISVHLSLSLSAPLSLSLSHPLSLSLSCFLCSAHRFTVSLTKRLNDHLCSSSSVFSCFMCVCVCERERECVCECVCELSARTCTCVGAGVYIDVFMSMYRRGGVYICMLFKTGILEGWHGYVLICLHLV